MPRHALLTAAVLAVFALSSLTALPEAEAKKAKKVKVEVKTSMGAFVIKLNAKKAPISVENFLQYANEGFYNGTVFHRVIDGFMVQGGGLTPDMKKKETRAGIKLEAGNGLSNKRGTVAMARTNDPNSATAQFFVNLVDNPRLDTVGGGYAVFGKVTKGMDVVDKIKAVKTGTVAGRPNVPVEAVTIESVSVLGKKKAKK